MKKIYMIWETEWGNTGIFFANEKEARDYCNLKNNSQEIGSYAHYIYKTKEMNFYNSMEDYKINSKRYKTELKCAIEGLKNSIEKVKNNIFEFYVEFEDGFSIKLSMKKFDEVLNKFNQKRFIVCKSGYEAFNSSHYFETHRYLSKDDLARVKEEYKKAKEKLKTMQNTLEAYQKEYIKLFDKDGEKELQK